MKLEINLETMWGYDDASVAEMLRDAIKDEIKMAAKRVAKDAVMKFEAEAKKEVDKIVKKDWRKIASIVEQLNTEAEKK